MKGEHFSIEFLDGMKIHHYKKYQWKLKTEEDVKARHAKLNKSKNLMKGGHSYMKFVDGKKVDKLKIKR